MFCITPDGIRLNQQLHKNGASDGQVLAHLEDAADAICRAFDDQHMDMMEESDENDEKVLSDLKDLADAVHQAIEDQYHDMGQEQKSGPIATVLRNAGLTITER